MNYLVDKPTKFVHEEIRKLTKQQSAKEEIIELKLKPSIFDPTSGRGMIKFQLSAVDNNDKTNINCEIIPTSFPKNSLYILAIILFIFTIVALITSFTFYSLLTIICAWTLMFIVVYLTQILNRGMLENQATMIINRIKA